MGHRGDREDLQQTGRVPRALGVGVFEGRQGVRQRAMMSGKRPWRIAVVQARVRRGDGYPREDHPRYVKDGTVPQSIGKGRALTHNHIRHSLDMPSGENGFRAWTDQAAARLQAVRVWMVRPAALQRNPRLQMRAKIEVAANDPSSRHGLILRVGIARGSR